MRRILRLSTVGLVLGLSGVISACHNPGNAWTECLNNAPHRTPGGPIDNVTGDSRAVFNIVYSCKIRHDTVGSTYHTYCIMPDGHTVFACAGPQSFPQQELGPNR